MRFTFRNNFAAFSLGCFALGACRSSVPNQVLTKPAPVTAAASQPVARDFWVFQPTPNRQLFVIDQRAAITTHRDSTTRIDSVASHTELSFSNANAAGTSIRGEITVFSVRAAGAAANVPVPIAFPLPFTARYPARDRQVVFDFDGYEQCGSPSFVAAQTLRDLTYRPPDTVRVGTTWSDSSTYLVCRDGIPMNATVRRTFRVTGTVAEGIRTLLIVSRQSQTALAGNGFPFGELTVVNGAGTGELVYRIDPATGEIISAAGTATLDLSERNQLRGAPRIQTAHQVAEIRIGRS
jgi:hypothetical protein